LERVTDSDQTELSDGLRDFFLHLRLERNLSENTISAYGTALNRYLRTLEDKGISRAGDIDSGVIASMFTELSALGLSARSVAQNLSAIKAFHRYLEDEKIAEEDPTINFQTPKIGKKLPQVLEYTEIKRILNAIDTSTLHAFPSLASAE